MGVSFSKLERVFKASSPIFLAGLIALIAFLLLDQTARSQDPDDFVWVNFVNSLESAASRAWLA